MIDLRNLSRHIDTVHQTRSLVAGVAAGVAAGVDDMPWFSLDVTDTATRVCTGHRHTVIIKAPTQDRFSSARYTHIN